MKPGNSCTREWRKSFGIAAVIAALASTWSGNALLAAEAEPPAFSVPGGVYTNHLRLSLQAGKATVRFTTDGTEPESGSTLYKESLEITNIALIRAKAWYPDGSVSRSASQSYILLGEGLAQFNSRLPVVILNTAGSEVTHEDKTFAAARFIGPKTGSHRLQDTPDFDGLAKLNVRGHSSLRYPKHSYTLKLVNELGDSQNASLLGLPKESDWVLYGPYPDKTLMRDALAYELSNKMGRWAPHWRYVEVFANESGGKLTMSHYAGVYMLVEKVTRAKERVAIAKLDPSDTSEPEISGGYIFKKDHYGKTERKRFGADGPPQATQASDRAGYPTPAGGFPADPAGFLPAYETKSNTKVTKTTGTTRPTAVPSRVRKRGKASTVSLVRTNHLAVAAPEGKKLDDAESFYDEEGFRTKLQDVQFYYHEPEPKDLTAVQRAWLKNYLNGLETALYGADFMDPKRGYRAWLDADSFIDHHLLVETTKNVDGFRRIYATL